MESTSLLELTALSIESGTFTAASYALMRRGEVVESANVGAVDNSPNAASIDSRTLFDVASLTKPVATATAALQLFDDGLLRPSTPVREVLPSLAGSPVADVTIAQLLTHSSGLPAVPHPASQAIETGGSGDGLEQLAATTLIAAPGSAYLYSDCGYILLGVVIEHATGAALNEVAQQRIFQPLDMADTGYLPNASHAIVATSSETRPGVVHDPRARAMGGVAGHAGLFSTAGDLLRFGEAVRIGGANLMSPEAASSMLRSQLAPEIGHHSYGWFCQGAPLFPGSDYFSPSAIAHSGFTGCVLAIDPARELVAALLTNRVYCSPLDNSRYIAIRRAWIEQVCRQYTAA